MAMAQRGLGKGLDALLKSSTAVAEDETVSEQQITDIPVDSISPSKFQPRRDFPAETLEELAQSIKEQGVLQPILVRAVPGRPHSYELIAGERRWRASQLAKIQQIPALIKAFSDEESMLIALVENLQREDLNAMDEAQGLWQLQQQLKLTQEELSEKIGKSRPAIANSLRLLQLPDLIKDHLRNGRISAGHARALLAVSDEEAQQQLHRRILELDLSVRETEAQASYWKANGQLPDADQATTQASKPKRTASQKSPEFIPLQQQMSQFFQTKVALRGDRSKGQIVLAFDSEEKLMHLLERLGGKDFTDNFSN